MTNRLEEYLIWFEKNLELVDEMSGFSNQFELRFFRGVWRAGYTYYEPYEGTYFLEYMSGKGESARKALRNAAEKSRPVLDVLTAVRERVSKPATFELNHKYVQVALGVNDFSCIQITRLRNEKSDHGRTRFRRDDTGHVLLYDQKMLRLIFNLLPLEIERLIVDLNDKPT